MEQGMEYGWFVCETRNELRESRSADGGLVASSVASFSSSPSDGAPSILDDANLLMLRGGTDAFFFRLLFGVEVPEAEDGI
jgi:hypothetical protein